MKYRVKSFGNPFKKFNLETAAFNLNITVFNLDQHFLKLCEQEGEKKRNTKVVVPNIEDTAFSL